MSDFPRRNVTLAADEKSGEEMQWFGTRREAGRALAVDSVLNGSIQRRGKNIRFNVRLVTTPDGASLRAGTFDEKFTNIFVVQDALANKVAAALALQSGGAAVTFRAAMPKREVGS